MLRVDLVRGGCRQWDEGDPLLFHVVVLRSQYVFTILIAGFYGDECLELAVV